MKIRRFVADDMQGALNQVKDTFGGDALILQTRHFRRGGFLGLFGRRLVEVTAAISDEEPQVNGSQEATAAKAHHFSSGNSREQVQDNGIKDELQDLKSMLDQMVTKFDSNAVSNNNGYPKLFQYCFRNLKASEVEEKLARQIIDEAVESVKPSLMDDVQEVNRVVEEVIARYFLKSGHSFANNGNKKRIIALVGPTGVGKTTTIAKLAALFSIIKGKSVALVTVDTYRVAAVEQLKTYADLMALPLETACTPKQFQEVLLQHEDKDLVLVDTAGRSPLNKMAMAELKAFMDACPHIEIFLVMGATTKQADLWEITSRFGQLDVNQLIFTKLDETLNYGVILNVVNRLQKGLAYITTGQNVPDDIEVPDPVRLARLILQVNNSERPG